MNQEPKPPLSASNLWQAFGPDGTALVYARRRQTVQQAVQEWLNWNYCTIFRTTELLPLFERSGGDQAHPVVISRDHGHTYTLPDPTHRAAPIPNTGHQTVG